MSDRAKEFLEDNLSEVLNGTDEVMDRIKFEADRHGLSPYEMRNSDGTYVMVPLLLARSTALAALVALRS